MVGCAATPTRGALSDEAVAATAAVCLTRAQRTGRSSSSNRRFKGSHRRLQGKEVLPPQMIVVWQDEAATSPSLGRLGRKKRGRGWVAARRRDTPPILIFMAPNCIL